MLIQPPGSLRTLFSKCKAKAATHQLCGRKRTRLGTPLLPVGMYLGVFLEHVTNFHWRRAVISHQTTTAGCWTVVTQVLVLLLTPERMPSGKRHGNLPHAWNHQHSWDKAALWNEPLATTNSPQAGAAALPIYLCEAAWRLHGLTISCSSPRVNSHS